MFYLPEARKPLSNFLVRENADAERRLAFDILIERNLGARQQTDRNLWLPDRGEAAGDGIVELCRVGLSPIWADRVATWCKL